MTHETPLDTHVFSKNNNNHVVFWHCFQSRPASRSPSTIMVDRDKTTRETCCFTPKPMLPYRPTHMPHHHINQCHQITRICCVRVHKIVDHWRLFRTDGSRYSSASPSPTCFPHLVSFFLNGIYESELWVAVASDPTSLVGITDATTVNIKFRVQTY